MQERLLGWPLARALSAVPALGSGRRAVPAVLCSFSAPHSSPRVTVLLGVVSGLLQPMQGGEMNCNAPSTGKAHRDGFKSSLLFCHRVLHCPFPPKPHPSLFLDPVYCLLLPKFLSLIFFPQILGVFFSLIPLSPLLTHIQLLH